MAALLATTLTAGAQDQPPTIEDPTTVFFQDENNPNDITTYRATDPDRLRTIFWTLRGVDADYFTIEGGTLRFKSLPDYERPRGMDLSATNTNTYKIIVRSSAGGEDGAPDLADDYDGDDLYELEVTVNVRNIDEPGKVTLSQLQPQVGTRLNATLADDDVQVGYGQWQWASDDSMNGPFTNKLTQWVDENLDPNADAYQPVNADLGKYLQVEVRYKDRADDLIRTERTVSTYPVRKDIVTSNANPVYPDQRVLVGGTTINRDLTRRYIPENSPAGTPVGAPVTAFDDERSIDVITYSLSDGTSTEEGVSNDHTKFAIDPATGQITVAAGTMLNRADDIPNDEGTTTYSVTVTATDGDGDSQDIYVTITVVKVDEPPVISRVDAAGDMVAPTEMSHYEARRGLSPAIVIDTDLDTYGITPGTDDAVYMAMDPEDGATGMTWSLEGDDGNQFYIFPRDKYTAKLSFSPKPPGTNFPDFENPMDKNGDNVYEVTIVITDSTLVNRDELDVTVKVINRTDDNRPGEVFLSNRQPEGASALTATLDDKDKPITNKSWQWYRSVGGSADTPEDCGAVSTPHVFTPSSGLGTVTDGVFTPTDASWEIIHGATSDTYTPMWEADADTTAGANDPLAADAGKCLMATASYTDWDAADPTMEDDPDTPTVDESQEHEKAHGVSYEPVVIEDRDNQKPEFRTDPDLPNSALAVSYVIYVPENRGPINIGILRDANTPGDGVLDEVVAAIDDETTTDTDNNGVFDRTVERNTVDIDDTLTYELSGPDKGSFKITGSIDMPVADEDNAGQLMTKGSLNFEKKKEYRLTLKATDPSGDSDSISIIVNVTDVNDPLILSGRKANDYEENGTGTIETYKATDEDINGITYSLVPGLGDVAVFTISSLDGTLTFKPRPDGKARPNYEKPEDVEITGNTNGIFNSDAVDNLYIVAVRARVAGTPLPTSTTTPAEATSFDDVYALNTEDMVHKIVRVRVLNMDEPPVFAMDMDTQEIKENPDDLLQDPRLNRGAGGDPALASLDIGIPVIAIDDDNEVDVNGNFRNSATATIDAGEINEGHMVDGLTYTLSGDGAGTKFDIVPATGQILTIDKLDYEAKNSYVVTVTATDTTWPMGLFDSTQITINVTDVDEVPVGGLLTLIGDASHYQAENNPDTTLGTYTVSGATAAVTWNMEGADASHFILEMPEGSVTSRSRMLKFVSTPNYEMPRGEVISDTNTNTYMVTVKVSAGGDTEMVDVTVTVTNVEEPGTVTLSSMGGKVGTPLTAALSDDDIVVGAIEWQWYRVDPATSSSNPITGAREDSYTPVAADVGNHLMVTATYTDREGAGKSASDSITTPVADANAAPEFAAATATHEVAENMPSGTLVGSPITATDPNGDNLTYRVSGADAASFTVDDGQLETNVSFDYEAKSSYSVTIMATDPEGLSGSIAVTVNVTNVDERGMVSLSPSQPSVGTPITASVTDPDSAPTGKTYRWSHSTAMNGTFTPYAAETTPRFTPRAADVDRYLRVTVNYNDVHGAQTESGTTEMAVIMNVAPAFSSETATRSVAENTAAGMNIGAPVMATDDDNDTLRYMLSGTDAASFDIGMSTGQLMTKAALDYETKMSYMVTVTATDPDGASGSIMVTIMVTDANEEPNFPSATATRSVAENTAAGMNIGDPVRAMDDDNDTLSYTLSGDDAMYFTIDGMGQIKVGANAMLDYETKMSYMVTVMATDPDGASDSIMVTIMVTDVDEGDPVDPVVARYDTNGDGEIQKSEVIAAINDYLFPQAGVDPISKAEVIRLINLYLFG